MPDDAVQQECSHGKALDLHCCPCQRSDLLAQLTAREAEVEQLKDHELSIGLQLGDLRSELDQAEATITDIKRGVRTLRADLRMVAEALQEIEWIRDHETDYEFCPACDETRAAGHAAGNCAMKTALDAVRDALRAQGGDTA